VGRAFAGVPGGDQVGRSDDPLHASFGAWFERERRLRRVPIDYVSVATRVDPARICALESGSEVLPVDGNGRALARTLARCIGADPEEAAARVGTRPRGWEPEGFEAPSRELVAALTLGILGLALLLGLSRIGSGITAPDDVPIVHRIDHVGQLLSDEAGRNERLTQGSN
jgi:hypothetical protein